MTKYPPDDLEDESDLPQAGALMDKALDAISEGDEHDAADSSDADEPTRRRGRKIPRYLEDLHVDQFFSAIPLHKTRDRVLFGLMFYCQLRVAEAVSVKAGDVSVTRSTLTVREGKGRKDRVVAIPPNFLIEIDEYLTEYGFTAADCIITSQKTDGHLKTDAVRKLTRRYSAIAKIDVPFTITPHTFRHSGARWLIDRGVVLTDLQKQLGHANLETTAIYTELTDTKRVDNILERFR